MAITSENQYNYDVNQQLMLHDGIGKFDAIHYNGTPHAL